MRTQPADASCAADDREFRRALGQFVTGVTVVTTLTADGVPLGLTVNSFNSVSLSPPMVLWSLSRASPNLAAFERAPRFAVNVLAFDQIALSRRFSRPSPDKFSGVAWSADDGGAPLLEGAAATFVCANDFQYYGGDHVIFVGTVRAYAHRDRAPLAYSAGNYARVEEIAAPVEQY